MQSPALFNPSSDNGPFNVILKRGEFIDNARSDRAVPYKIYLPESIQNQKFPVIVWSHGFGGNRDGAAFLSRYLASHGYILVHVTHHGTDSSLWEGQAGHPWDILRAIKIPREATLNRFQDVPFVLDRLPDWASENIDGAQMDLSRIGMSGHSFGAMTTQVMAGQFFPGLSNELIQMKEPRFKAGIVYSPVPIGHLTDASSESLYGPIDVPLLHMTGTDDESPLEGHGYEERLIVYKNSGDGEKYLLVKNDADHMVYNGTRGKLEVNPNREKHEELIKIFSRAFWDAYLKGDQSAYQWLTVQAPLWVAGSGRFEFSS